VRKNIQPLGAFAKLRKATISLVMSVSPHGKKIGSRTDFHEICFLSILRKSSEENLSFIKI
jgi:hypothetical protein